jgi:hypothetical protein
MLYHKNRILSAGKCKFSFFITKQEMHNHKVDAHALCQFCGMNGYCFFL